MSTESNFGKISGACTTASWLESVTRDTDRVILILEKGKDVITTGGPVNVLGANMRRDSDGTDTLI